MKQLIECRFCDVIIVVCAIRTVLHYCVVITVVCAIRLYAIYSCYSILYESSSYILLNTIGTRSQSTKVCLHTCACTTITIVTIMWYENIVNFTTKKLVLFVAGSSLLHFCSEIIFAVCTKLSGDLYKLIPVSYTWSLYNSIITIIIIWHTPDPTYTGNFYIVAESCV